jgi:hypothetical protein
MLMDAMHPTFPPPVADMCADLVGMGFDIEYELRSDPGTSLLVLGGPVKVEKKWLDAFVQISANHGQWSVSVKFDHMEQWISAQTWLAHLDGGEPGEPDLGRQTRLVRYHLADAAAAYLAAPDLEHRLAEPWPN